MTHQPQHSKTTIIAKFSATIMLSILISSSFLSNAISRGKTENYLNSESFKTQLLEDPTFLSKLKEKLIPLVDDYDIQKIVREYLLTNPEIMIEMQLILQEKLENKNKQKTQTQASIINLFKKEIFQSPHDAVLGNPNGKRVLIDFFDYNCGYCKMSYSYIENLIKEYPDLRVVVKDLPILGPDSMAAHSVAYAFRQLLPEKYPQFHKALLTNKSRANEAKAIKIAISLGADEKELRNALTDSKLQNSFKENMQIASALNITGTPSYIIGDKVLIGAVSQDILKKSIEHIK
ncbi:DsbA family protein [Bartonella harrusi]|uniref:DsbA family protein n=1 Tax=Bartonella harrusi TaxID=2961895 RepID=A0ABY5EVH7_9HYPH|nr:DsbA family protein [Bartonella harrusi]UTO29232.1 DsbA family protein [Bartonella harrusi]